MLIEPQLFKPSVRGNIWEVLRIAFPLILASAGHSINLFVDRIMLQHYSEAAMAASFPAGLTAFSIICYFVGTVCYGNAFVAQYFGARMCHRVGAAVWQAVYMALIGGLFAASTCLIAEPMFDFFGHEPYLRPMEVTYFRILSAFGFVPLLSMAFSCFWGGRGETKMIMAVNLGVTAINIPLNALLIFGYDAGPFRIPSMGISGAGYATVLADGIGVAVMMAFFFLSRRNAARYRTWNARLDRDMFPRLFKFGGPNGIQLFLDLAAFNAFVVLLGKIGPDVLNASGAAFALNSLAMIPMFGLGQTVSILVGQGIGANDIPYAERAVKSARFLLYIVLLAVAVLFVIYPEPSLRLFKLKPDTNAFSLAGIMLKFIAAYLLFDATSILYGSAVKGAGDTRFSMWIGAGYAWILYGFPCILVFCIFTRPAVVEKLGTARASSCNLWTLWTICVLYIMCLGVTFYLRYRGGKWKSMKVIEDRQCSRS